MIGVLKQGKLALFAHSMRLLPTKGQATVLLFRLASRLPLPTARFIGRLLGRFLAKTDDYNKKVTAENIALCYPNLSEPEQKKMLVNSLQHTGMTAFEMAQIWLRPNSWLTDKVTVRNQEIFDRALEKGKGVILMAPHLGNWEVIGKIVGAYHPLMNMYEPPEHPEMDTLIRESRCSTGALLAPANQRGVVMLMKHLKSGKAVGILPDQVPEDRKRSAVLAPFFNHPAHTMTLLGQMLQKTGATAIAVVAFRTQQGFEMQFSPVNEKLYSADAIESAGALNSTIEALVAQAPEQYQWEYKRFRASPIGAYKKRKS